MKNSKSVCEFVKNRNNPKKFVRFQGSKIHKKIVSTSQAGMLMFYLLTLGLFIGDWMCLAMIL